MLNIGIQMNRKKYCHGGLVLTLTKTEIIVDVIEVYKSYNSGKKHSRGGILDLADFIQLVLETDF